MEWSAIRAVIARPGLWVEAMRATIALAPRGWWRRPPFVPIPDAEYLAWRTATAYGRADTPIAAHDIITYLQWRRRQHSPGGTVRGG